ncbi:YqjF family protein [Halobacillus amylolyticus]|uniref:DUF2071 domain-containing protein n=1 Tax=Halobacillus amylolyticus TaxID=2932259 RepID=A0ABY4H860_9BACI|nr:DUF2071 domain-containing protein [Halobacillus amylolyticus]UOR11066.1 DUF2071 domain-containing protein [Halobacillus amylolyticus]
MSFQPWTMYQEWEELTFFHWPMPTHIIRPFVPKSFEIDTFEGSAWLAVVPFHINHMRLRGLPPLPYFSHLLELNVRTYVTYKGEPGVYFLSLDANHPAGVVLARQFNLPYLHANMRLDRTGHTVHYTSRRTHNGYPPAHFHACVHPFGAPFLASPGSLLYWLTERYALWLTRKQHVFKGPIVHKRWQLQHASADISIQGLTTPLPNKWFIRKPITHFSKSQQTHLFPFKRTGYCQ